MELSNENIDRLIVRYLSGNLELQDKRVLETWISNNQDNYDYFLKKTAAASACILQSTWNSRPKYV